eukprot:CAMPEP_0184692486 /NCGR_PEP_ID=MMETSP0313-20130426/953_1 /TAXON_ID=2792 /ORGANISM="Porphyridium aerugineum, Strain SAG 1380-2" /LENGTH=388 /DNA_ID=CAMNT_0027150321 /DNA_START=94 /DNA_END=1260 /DNA_ORIENTATION=+
MPQNNNSFAVAGYVSNPISGPVERVVNHACATRRIVPRSLWVSGVSQRAINRFAFVPANRVTSRAGQPIPSQRSFVQTRSKAKSSTAITMVQLASAMVYISKWIEDNLDYGVVVSRSGTGMSSGWSSTGEIVTQSGKKLFLKYSTTEPLLMFRGEAESLRAMHATNTIRVPYAYHYGELDDPPGFTFILMEHLNFSGRLSQAELGESLARMHLAEPVMQEAKNGKFGFSVDNTIGGTYQPNEWMNDWVEFFIQRRIMHQVKLARDPTLRSLAEKLCKKMPDYFRGITVKPSILHGDLWSGNVSSCGGKPVIFDPATYYGHHEAEFGMSWCANFSSEFYDAYHSLIPKEPGWHERRKIYTLYHYLNHYNLFGGGYYNSAKAIIDDLLGL